MKFLWESNAPWVGTGYGQQTNLVVKQLATRGHTPTIYCFFGLQGGELVYDGMKCLPPSGFDIWGNDALRAHLEREESDVYVSLMDLFVLDEAVIGNLPVPWVAWVPIDCERIGPPTMERLRHVNYPVAMSNFGAEQMRAEGIEPSAVIYHAVDTDVFRPQDRTACRKSLEIEDDCYLIGMVMANKGDRKQYPAQFEAIRVWMDEHPDRKIKVYIHSEPTPNMGGWDLRKLVEHFGLTGHVYSTNQYDTSVVPAPYELLARVYGAMDVLMNCSAGEGFGVPIVEAQACGIPVITGGYTAMKEITWNGYTVKAESRSIVSHYGYQFRPDTMDMVFRLESVYRMNDKAKNEMGREMVIANCSVDVVAAQWEHVLKEVSL